MGVDFNCAINAELDRKKCSNNRDVGKIDLKQLIHQHNLEDVCRRRFPSEREYSWSRGDKASRIDYWFISTSLDSQIESVKYKQCSMSDHKTVELTIRISETEHGMGTWKMHLKVIQSKLFKYCFCNIWKAWQDKKGAYPDTNIWWDLGKKKIKELAKWCSYKLKEDRETFKLTLEKKNELFQKENRNAAGMLI